MTVERQTVENHVHIAGTQKQIASVFGSIWQVTSAIAVEGGAGMRKCLSESIGVADSNC